MARRYIRTKYGKLRPDLESLNGSPVLYFLQSYTVRKGRKLPSGRPLKESVLIRAGAVVMPRLVKPESGQSYFLWQISPYGIYDALRSVLHIQLGYRAEDEARIESMHSGIRVAEIDKLEDVRSAFNLMLSVLAVNPGVGSEQRQAVRELLDEKREAIGMVRDRSKRAALEHMVAASKERDSLGRNNPSVRMASLVAADNDLADRLRLIEFMEPRIGARAISLAIEEARIRRIYRAAYNTLDALRSPTSVAGLPLVRYQALIARTVRRLSSIRVGPYPMAIKRLRDDLHEVVNPQHEIKGDRERRIEHLDRAVRSMRFKRARWDLEELRLMLSLNARSLELWECVKGVLKQRLEEWRAKVVMLDDSGFKKPIKEDVLRHSQMAVAAIDHASVGISDVREGLKKAAVLL